MPPPTPHTSDAAFIALAQTVLAACVDLDGVRRFARAWHEGVEGDVAPHDIGAGFWLAAMVDAFAENIAAGFAQMQQEQRPFDQGRASERGATRLSLIEGGRLERRLRMHRPTPRHGRLDT